MTGNDEATPRENPPPEELPEAFKAEAAAFEELLDVFYGTVEGEDEGED
jgi:hypothetical protein